MRKPYGLALMTLTAFSASLLALDSPRVLQRGAEPIGDPVVPWVVDVDLRDLEAAPAWRPGDAIKEVPRRRYPRADAPAPEAWTGPDPLLARQSGEIHRGIGVTEVHNFAGQGFTGVNPPDTVGDVGPGLFIQSINGGGGALVRIHDTGTGAVVVAPFAMDSLGSGACASGFGDPVVLYDELADRWLLSEFAGSGNHLCVYVSQTSDPIAGGWFAYDFATPSFPDYPKYGVWPDAYYVTTNESSPAIYALDRAQMLAGGVATMQRFTAPSLPGFPFEALTPADHDGVGVPAPGAPGIILRHRDTEVHGPAGNPTFDLLEIFEFDVDWVTPANSTFTQLPSIQIAEIDSDLCGLSSFSCIPQPGTGTQLDPLREVVMFRLAYRRTGSTDVLVGNLVTDVDGTDHAGKRWFELRDDGGGWSLAQEGTYAPDDDGRWMGAIAMDSAGNILLGYNVSSGATFPGLRYTGRLAADPSGTMGAENLLVAGSASNGSNRYGDYASMSVDPTDGCTFWFTGEYNTSSQWSTRIGALRFDACGLPDFTLSPSPQEQAVCAPDDAVYSVAVGSVAGYSDAVTLSAAGHPAGTSVGFAPNPVTPAGSSTMTVAGTGGATAGSYTVTVTGTAAGPNVHSVDVGLDIVAAAPGAPALVSPADGATDVSLAPTLNWSAVTGAVEYLVEVDDDAGFGSPEFAATTAATSIVATGLAPLTLHHWRVGASNVCGPGAPSAVFTFTTRGVPAILLVDDDDDSPDVGGTYAAALGALGEDFDLWETGNSDDEPAAVDLAPYEAVIWFTGDEFGGAAGPGTAGEAALAQYLDDGGCLFLSSQDYHFDRGLTPFMTNYLGVSSVADDSGDYDAVAGVAGSLFAGLGPFTLDYPFTDFADVVSADATSLVSMRGDNSNDAGVEETAGGYLSVFFGFPWEAISVPADRQAVFSAFLDGCRAGEVDRTLDVTVAGNGSVTSTPVGIDCPGDCTQDYPDGTPVALAATADPGWVFSGWSGDCAGTGACNLTMSADRSVTATFVEITWSLGVSVTGPGTVTSSPAGISCPGDCGHDYPDGTMVGLTATPGPDAHLVAWNGDCTGSGGCSVAMTAARTVGAQFDTMPFVDGFESGDTTEWSAEQP
jgi:hypothetical protein